MSNQVEKFKFNKTHLSKKKHSPLKKTDNAITVDDILKSDKDYFEVAFISELMVLGLTNKQMAEKYEEKFGKSISISKVSDLKSMAKMVYLAQITKNRDEMVAEQLMQADMERRELYEAWMKSKNGKSKTRTREMVSNGVSPELTFTQTETETIRDESFGDVSFLKQIDQVNRRTIDLLGLEAPKQQAIQNMTLPSVVINVVGTGKKVNVEEANVIENG